MCTWNFVEELHLITKVQKLGLQSTDDKKIMAYMRASRRLCNNLKSFIGLLQLFVHNFD